MSQEFVTVAILAKDKAHVLPLYLDMIEQQTYPSSQINLYIRTNNNNDGTTEMLKTWLDRVKDAYHEVYFDDRDVEESVQNYGPREWNPLKLKVLGRIRQESVQWAMERGTHYFVADCDNFIAPDTIERLLNTKMPVIGPLLKVAETPQSHYANFHHQADESGYMKPSSQDYEILYGTLKGLVQVDVIHCTYFIRNEFLRYVRYDDESGRYDYVIFSDGLRKAGIPQYLDNRRCNGAVTFVDTVEDFVTKNVERNFYELAGLQLEVKHSSPPVSKDAEKEEAAMSPPPAFKAVGEGTQVQPGGVVDGAEHITMGRQVSVQAPYWLTARVGSDHNEASPPLLSMGDGCTISSGLVMDASRSVKLECNVMIGPNVYITDKIPAQLRDDPFLMRYEDRRAGELTIGADTLIDSGVVVEGSLCIGRGCIIRSNSVVLQDIPDYCEASGNPARITRIYMPHPGDWVAVASREEAEMLLEQRQSQPFLSICIPTYNRAACLDQCLQSIFSQIGDTPLIEVNVSDNASPDETPEVVRRYMEKYSNLRYSRNDENLGADRNILKVLDEARGLYIKLQGDDNYFVENSIWPLLSLTRRNADCGLIYINVLNGDGNVIRGEGAESYLGQISFIATYLPSLILRRADWHKVEDKTRFNGTSLSQFYFVLNLLCSTNPKFAIFNSVMFAGPSNEPREHTMGEVFIRNYLNILGHFVGRGLSEEAFKRDKHWLLHAYVMPQYEWNLRHFAPEYTTDVVETFVECYKDEPYYQDALAWFHSVI
ncbi:glycosyltransferase [Paenibacillus medicaginis]|uniref:Glycosyltransferase n=1 Tax=Paenibacillus medicaginis TaxID=1470560 RepID=A0ABV5C8R8_9BACL